MCSAERQHDCMLLSFNDKFRDQSLLGYERVYLSLCKVAYTPFHIPVSDVGPRNKKRIGGISIFLNTPVMSQTFVVKCSVYYLK